MGETSLAVEKGRAPSVDVKGAYGSFVLNIKVLGSEAGAGVPTLPVRIPQILDASNQVSFSKLVDIVIMIASSQQPAPAPGPTSSLGAGAGAGAAGTPGTAQRIQHHVLLSFPNPQTHNSVMISSGEELLEVMSRYRSQQQLTLIAKVQQEIVPVTTTEKRELSRKASTTKETSLKSPTRKTSLTVPGLLEEQQLPSLEFDPPMFHPPHSTKEDPQSPILVSLMEQLLDIQSHRMLQFANHMEGRFQQIVDQRLVTSEEQLKQCLRETVQLVEEDCKDKDDDSLHSNDSSNNTNLEKMVKDQMVSMELRFAKLEEQSKETAAIAKLSPSRTSSPPATEETIQQRFNHMESKLEHMEQLMVMTRKDAETTKNATMAWASSSSSSSQTPSPTNSNNSTRKRQSPNNTKPPLPPSHHNHRSKMAAAVEPLLLLPRLDEALPPPPTVSPSVLSTPLPPSIPSSPNRSRSPSPTSTTIRPVSPPTTHRNSLLVPPPLTPLSPPNSSRRSSVNTEDADNTDADDIELPYTGTPNDSPEDNNNKLMTDDSGATPTILQEPQPPTLPLPMSPDVIQSDSRRSSGYSMPSLTDISVGSSAPTGGQRKKTVRDMLMVKGQDGSDGQDNKQGGDPNKKRSSLPIQFPMLDASRGDLFLSTPTQSSPPKSASSAFTFPSRIQAPPFDTDYSKGTTTTDVVSPATTGSPPLTASETKMKQAIKDHMQSMESRVSKLRELNATTPSTATLTPATTMSSPRTLFPDSNSSDNDVMEKVLTQKMDFLSDSLQSTIEDATKASVDTKMADMEALLQRKLQQMQKAVALAGSDHGPPSSPQRRSSFPDVQVLEDFMDGRMDQLTELMQAHQEKVVQELVLSKTSVEVQEGQTVPASALMDQLQSVVDKRMDNIESLVQLTATELEHNTKASQQRLNQKLLEKMTETLRNQLPPADDSIATSNFPTIYGDDDQSIDVEEEHRENQNQEEADTSGEYMRGRSLEADLVAMDRQASIRDIYGASSMDIDDEDLGSSGDLTGHSRGTLGRGKSLRDLCNIDTIEEGSIEEEAEEATSRHSDPGTVLSAESKISARSALVRHTYGEGSIDIDDEQQSAEAHKGSDTPPVIAKRSMSVRSLTSGESDSTGEDQQEDSVGPNEQTDRAPWRADRDEAARGKDTAPTPADRTTSTGSIESAAAKKDRAPAPVDRAVSTRAIVGESEADDSSKSAVPIGQPEVPDILKIYDSIDIDIDLERRSVGAQPSDNVYDNLSLDGVKETRTFVSALDGSGGDSDSDFDGDEAACDYESGNGEEDDEQASVSIDGDSVQLSISTNYDSESSKEDEEYFHDHARRHLAVLATSMAKVRAAKKATRLYNQFQEHIFISKRDGPLAIKIKSVAEYDGTDEGDRKMTLSDDESSVGNYGQEAASGYDNNGSSATLSHESEQNQYNRSKASAFVVAMAVSDRRSADRAIRGYRRMLHKKFLPRKRNGPMALTDRSDSTAQGLEASNPSSDSSTSGVYVEDEGTNESLAASFPSIDTGGGMVSSSEDEGTNEPLAASFASIDTGGGIVESSKDDGKKEPLAASFASIDTGGGMVATSEDEGTNEPLAGSFAFIDTGGGIVESSEDDGKKEPLAASFASIDTGGGMVESSQDEGTNEPLAASFASIDTGGGLAESSDRGMNDSERVSLSNPSIGLECQTAVDSCWIKPLHDGNDSNSEASSSPAVYSSALADVQGEQEQTTAQAAALSKSIDGVDHEQANAGVAQSVSSVVCVDDTPEPPADINAEDDDNAMLDLPARSVYATAINDDESLHLGEHMLTTAQSPPDAKQPKPVYAVFDEGGETMGWAEAEQLFKLDTLAESQEAALQQEAAPDAVWEAMASQPPTRESLNARPPRSPPHEAESVEEEGAFKPEQMPKRPPQSPRTEQSRKASWRPFDESEGNLEGQTKDLGEEKEIEEWEAVANMGSPSKIKAWQDLAAGESKHNEEPPLERVDHIQDMKAQIKNWEDIFLETNRDQKASNQALRVSNESLQNSVQESIEDSHHFAAYLDKMLTERIGQLEEAIRAQMALATQSLVSRNDDKVMVHPLTGGSPPRVRSAPASPLNRHWTAPAAVARGVTHPMDGESKEPDRSTEQVNGREALSSMVVEVTEWKRLQDKLRGTEEVAESYRKQVLTLRNVLEGKINEGNASLHQVEVLQRKLQDAHDREVQAQKQLRPVTRRVEQVIQEMVQLEEHSANLQVENGRLREQLWLAQREF